jgi:UDP-N-acetylmuramate dehydrogenase
MKQMSVLKKPDKLIDRLPMVRGRYTAFAPLGDTSWFRAGGCAEVLYKPADKEDLCDFLKGCPSDVPITVLGVCSNVIIRDGGIAGVVIKMGRGFTDIEQEGSNTIYAGAAALDVNVALSAQNFGIGGLEFFSGIPGTIGGALRMNAGAYGTETADVLVQADVIDRQGQIHHIKVKDPQMLMSYRHNSLSETMIFVGGYFKGIVESASLIESRILEIKEKRAATQPIKARTGGSTFANPTVQELVEAKLPEDKKAWQLIDEVGGRGLLRGGAQMSEKHCNFMINTGEATAHDLETLGEEIKGRVFESFGLTLRWEIRRLGQAQAFGAGDVMGEC